MCVRDGMPYFDRGQLRFWEAFPMEAGAVRYGGEDTWGFFSQAVAEGRTTFTGSARFYTADALGDERPDQADSPFQTDPITVGNSRLPATDREPGFWRDDPRPTLDRMMRVSWQCCPAMITVIEEDTHDR